MSREDVITSTDIELRRYKKLYTGKVLEMILSELAGRRRNDAAIKKARIHKACSPDRINTR